MICNEHLLTSIDVLNASENFEHLIVVLGIEINTLKCMITNFHMKLYDIITMLLICKGIEDNFLKSKVLDVANGIKNSFTVTN
jgi:hypothetical protein